MIHSQVRRNGFILPGLALALTLPLGAQTLSPASLVFAGQVQGTTSPAKTVTLKNTNTVALTISSIAATGNFAHSGGTCSTTLAKNASCTILITFTPEGLGALTGSLKVTDNAGNSPQTASLSGKGIAPVVVSPTSLSFAKLPVGETSSAMSVTLTNNQSTALTFTSLPASTGDFAVASNTCPVSPATLAGGGTCTVGVTFTPTLTGSRSGSLTFSDNAANTPQTVSLAGTGIAAALLSIAVTPANQSIFVGGMLQLTATGTYSNGTNKTLSSTVTWSTSPLGIVSIGTSGLATGLAVGATTVTAALGAVTGSTMLTDVQLFVPTGNLNTARYYHSATLLDNGGVLVAGGIGPVPGGQGALGPLATAELYNPNTGAFTYTGLLNTARDEHSATLLNNGTVLMAGGSGGDDELASAEIYNPATQSFTATAGSLNTARYEHTATMLPSGEVLLAGGYGVAGVLGTAELYNPATGMFSYTAGSLNNARFDATATLLSNGMVLIAGGADANGPLASAELYNPATAMFTLTSASLNTARSGATATLLNGGLVLIAAGYNYLTTGPLASAELYDPNAGTFTVTGSESRTSWLGTATLLTDGTVLFAGSVYNASASEVYFPITGTFSINSGLTTPSDLQTATQLPDGAVLVAGGFSDITNSVLATAELYEPPVLVPMNLTSISITPAGNPTLTVGSSEQLMATGNFSNSTTQQLASVIWTSSNPTVGTVTDDDTNSGVIYAVSPGITAISACTGTVCAATQLTVTTGAVDHR